MLYICLFSYDILQKVAYMVDGAGSFFYCLANMTMTDDSSCVLIIYVIPW